MVFRMVALSVGGWEKRVAGGVGMATVRAAVGVTHGVPALAGCRRHGLWRPNMSASSVAVGLMARRIIPGHGGRFRIAARSSGWRSPFLATGSAKGSRMVRCTLALALVDPYMP